MANAAQHGAAGQALGYLHQCMWALVEFGRRASPEPDVQLRLEVLDDVQFDKSGTPEEVLQVKHHVNGRSALSENSVDLWRTLNVWMDLELGDDVLLRLVTTQETQSTSTLSQLRAGVERDDEAVLATLVKAAQASDNQISAPWRDKFLRLDEAQQYELISRIVVDDGAPPASDLDRELIRVFRFAIPVGREKVFLHILKGWWAAISVRLLSRELHAISGQDLLIHVTEITDQLKTDSLPVDPSIRGDFDESVAIGYSDRPFVQQLLWIALESPRLLKAIRDYHRSFTQRSFWLRYQLLSEGELDAYAFRLFDEWEQVFDTRVAAMRRSGRNDLEIVGQEILETLALESKTRLRARFDEQWFNRGMLHALADGELGQRIGWHPDFEAKLEELLTRE